MSYRTKSAVAGGLVLLGLCGLFCLLTWNYGEEMSATKISVPLISEVEQSSWEALSTKKIYFGHQSVGFNIVDGIEQIVKENSLIELTTKETMERSDFQEPLFGHSTVGKNRDPNSKTDAFSLVMKSGVGEEVDIAFFKFCYVDIKKGVDVGQVFDHYKESMAELRSAYPDVLFVHVTVPLTTIQTGPKAFVKMVIGRAIRGFDDNIQRHGFNEMLRQEYAGKEPVFDLAKFESVAPDGRQSIFHHKGETYFSLLSEYTDDGGHLNEKGRIFIAEQLLIFLATL